MRLNPRTLDNGTLRLHSSTSIEAVEAQTNAQQTVDAEHHPPAKVRDRTLRNWLLLANALFWLIVIIVIRIT